MYVRSSSIGTDFLTPHAVVTLDLEDNILPVLWIIVPCDNPVSTL
jgi:hypothetical protein